MRGTQRRFDAEVTRAMTRRDFLARLTRASAAAVLASGCGTVQSALERPTPGDAASIFDPVQREVVARIIDGFNPPDTELRRRLKKEDPGYDPVAVYAQFAWASGDEIVQDMKFLIDFIDVLPTFTLPCSPVRGSSRRLRLFHPDDANRYFLYLRDSNLRALRNVFSGAKFIGTAPLYTNERVAWKMMNYPGPWIRDPSKPAADLASGTSFDMAAETESNVADLRRRVVPHDKLWTSLQAGKVVGGGGRLLLQADGPRV